MLNVLQLTRPPRRRPRFLWRHPALHLGLALALWALIVCAGLAAL